jgi:Glyoxalase/Bleomycin resistance protein/Dioxygenase superfamily
MPGDTAVTGIGFVGIRSERPEEMAKLLSDVMGAEVTRRTPDLVGMKLQDGTVVEVYGPSDDFHAFFTTGPVVGFSVADFEAAREAMVAAGVRFIGEIQHADGKSWQHFFCPDGTVAEIIGPSPSP